MKPFLLSFCLLIPVVLSAQFPGNSAFIDAGKIQAHIEGTGIRSHGSGGGLLMPAADSTQAPVRGVRTLGLWATGVDPGGNLKTSADMGADLPSDFEQGFRDIPNSGVVWKVTDEEIQAHRADFEDDGVIDNPIPAIFAWPGAGNPYSVQYNGFSISSLPSFFLADFQDFDFDEIYNPSTGDFPSVNLRSGEFKRLKSIVFMPFYDRLDLHPLTIGTPLELDATLVVYSLHCDAAPELDETLFFEYKFLNSGYEGLDQLQVGFYLDPDIGNPNDDYLGTDITTYCPSVYAYNSDTLQDATFGEDPPILSVNLMKRPLDTTGSELGWAHSMPVRVQNPNFQPGTLPPAAPIQFYHNLSGRWKDGTPLTIGGLGYDPNNPDAPPSEFAYTNWPNQMGGWSELAAGNYLGDRRVLVSFKPFYFKPGAVNELVFTLTYQRDTSFSASLKKMQANAKLQIIMGGFYGFINPAPPSPCEPVPLLPETLTTQLRIFPIPASDYLHIQPETNEEIIAVQIFDISARPIAFEKTRNLQKILVSGFSPGLYFLRVELGSGELRVGKFAVLR